MRDLHDLYSDSALMSYDEILPFQHFETMKYSTELNDDQNNDNGVNLDSWCNAHLPY